MIPMAKDGFFFPIFFHAFGGRWERIMDGYHATTYGRAYFLFSKYEMKILLTPW